ncbi:MAG: plasmid pRiA4b ORF-3 family protein [Erysipelotrichaceae bacterium]|nr:plasmid pRiA4b ORF-3 family protein [Erysipelotrichaceae bacterium]MDP3305620.1 plasmid pRiA4b ORF-3 family protein [Erysipelotrichaceae bacterium]
MSYILKISFVDSEPLIWRKVIVPDKITYHRLHQVIQLITNFESVYEDYHLYEFDLYKENMCVTNNKGRFEQHRDFLNNRAMYEERLSKMKYTKYVSEKARQLLLSVNVKMPSTIKIDDFIIKHKKLKYHYDFGDGWEIEIELLDIKENDDRVIAEVLDGENIAPMEDCGGLYGFYGMLEILSDTSHPDYAYIREWLENKRFEPFHQNKINEFLSYEKLKKASN